jgi:hypothetical protein
MRQIFVILIVALVWLPLALIASYFDVFEFVTPKKEILIVPAIEKPIKIRPINTSCMPFIKKAPIYAEAELICEIQDTQCVRLGAASSRRNSGDRSVEDGVQIKVSKYSDEVTTNSYNSYRDERFLKRTSSLNILMSCNNDI